MKMRRRAMIMLTIPMVFLFTTAESCETEQDAVIENRDVGPADVINMPDGFSNFASKCDGPNRVYTVYHGTALNRQPYGAIAVVANDPRCVKAPK